MTMPHDVLHHLRQEINNYQGYADLDVRQQSDKQVRHFLISKINALVEKLAQDIVIEDSTEQDRLEALVSSTSRKLGTIHQSLKRPTYVEESFFRSAAIPESRLVRIYDLENNMLEEIDGIRVELGDLIKNTQNRATVEDHFLHIDAFVDNINQALFEREALILGDE